MTIALVEDNENIREALKRYIELEGWKAVEFGAVEPFEAWLGRQGPTPALDLLVLDVMLPDGDGFLLARRIRKHHDVPVLFLTARTEESDRITGLEIGAEDYVTKPFSNREVILRIKTILRRRGGSGAGTQEALPARSVFSLGSSRLDIDLAAMQAAVDGRSVVLTAAEWTILAFLARRGGQVSSRTTMLQECLGSIAEGSERTIDTHVKNLRHKLGSQEWIETVRSFGYKFGGKAVEPC